MSRLRHMDIIVELVELCQDIMNDIRQQLSYYRASVYKDETAEGIQKKVEQLRLVTDLIGDDMVQEPMKDYDAMADQGGIQTPPGECSFSARVTCLLQSLDSHLGEVRSRITNQGLQTVGQELTRTVQKHRNQLLSLCRYGSRQWAFFQSL